jgi:hypothetical protein
MVGVSVSLGRFAVQIGIYSAHPGAWRRQLEQKVRKHAAQLINVAGLPQYESAKKKAAAELTDYLRKAGDPRITVNGDVFDRYPFWGTDKHA